MSISTIRNSSEIPFKHHEKEYTVRFTRPTLKFDVLDIVEGYDLNLARETFPSFISDNKKIIISLNIGMYNFYYMCVPLILKAHEMYPDAELLLDSSGVVFETGSTYYDFLPKLLDDLGVNYKIIDATRLEGMLINNFYTVDSFTFCDKDTTRVYNTMKKYVKNPEIEPFRKVYVSRKKVPDRTFKFAKPDIEFNSDNRIIDEDVLEDFFTSVGIEVVNPEDFPNFEDQINYFYQTKLLISLTSSGIANALFMKPRGTVFELVTPLIQAMAWYDPLHDKDMPPVDTREDIHHLYNALVYNKDHDYLSIQNRDRKSETIINKIINSKAIMSIIKED